MKKLLVVALLVSSGAVHADAFDHQVFAGQVTGVFKEMQSWFAPSEPTKPVPVSEARPTTVNEPVSRVKGVEVSDANVQRIRDETCAKPNAACFRETFR